MYAPGGFNAVVEAWSTLGIYAKVKLLDHLPQKFTCILFDRRECGQSGGRVERVTWMHFVAQGKGLLDHLGIARAHIMGGCMGCGPVAAFGAAHPHMVASMILYWPVGGYKYRLSSHKRFAEHLGFVRRPRACRPSSRWCARRQAVRRRPARRPVGVRHQARCRLRQVLRRARYATHMFASAKACATRCSTATPPPARSPRTWYVPKYRPLSCPGTTIRMRLRRRAIWTNACRLSEYWDMPVERQTEDATNARVLEFLDKVRVARIKAG